MTTVPEKSARFAQYDPARAVRIWLGLLILLTFAMILIGGATRLAEAGLSITRWELVMGVLPPFTEAAWLREFEFYRQTPQFELLNSGMTLANFKTIYWWEWAHRELGRFIGLFYIAGFLWFAWRRSASPGMLSALAGMGLLLGTQGLVGWIMVASGLQPGMTAVAPVRLTLHLTLATLFFAALVAMFVRLGAATREPARPATRVLAWALVALGIGQIALGGLVAGHDAGLTYNSWPLMNGRFVPSGLWTLEPAWRNFIDNVTTIQFNHRIGGYGLGAAILAYAIVARGEGAFARGRALFVSVLVLAQIGLGVVTLLAAAPIGLALAHQGLALILILALTWNASVMRRCSV